MTHAPGPRTLPAVTEEGERLARAAHDAGLPFVPLGGVAVWLRCPSARAAPLARDYGDADFIGHARARKDITAFMEQQGYEADRMFNALHGATRLNFHDAARDRPVDVLLDRFSMCHTLDLSGRIDTGELTIPLADLLLTKLQVVQLNEKDVLDLLALLADHDLGPHGIDVDRILEVTHGDWGFEHTITATLRTLRERLAGVTMPPEASERVVARASALEAALAAAPKAARWKLRARVGERVRWYEEPEEARA